MQLWHRIALAHAAMFAALLLVILAGQRQVGALDADVAQASEEYEELRTLAAANAALIEARTQINHHRGLEADSRARLNEAIERLNQFLSLQPTHTTARPHQDQERSRSRRSVERVRAILDRADRGEVDAEADLRLIGASLEDVGYLSGMMDGVVAQTHANAVEQVRQSRRWASIAPAAALVVALMVGFWQHQSVVKPVHRLRRGASLMAGGDLSSRVDDSGRDEIAALAADFNRMASRLEMLYRDLEEQVRTKSRELAHAERLSSLGFLAAGIAHEINNPLSIIHGYAQEAREHGPAQGQGSGSIEGVLDIILSETRRCRDIVRRLLSLASPGEPTRTRLDMNAVAESVLGLVRDLPSYCGRLLQLAPPTGEVIVMATPEEMKQVLLNLIINALEATAPEGGVVELRCRRQDDRVLVDVEDNGCGMDEQTLLHVFDPFFTANKADGRRGVGLGLSISFTIIQQHGGTLRAASDGQGRGSRFSISLPAAPSQES